MAKISSNYELIFIVDPRKNEEETKTLVEKFKTQVESNAAESTIDEWGKRHLAYPINDQEEGYYVFMTFTAPAAFPAELSRVLRITDGVMRSLIVDKSEA